LRLQKHLIWVVMSVVHNTVTAETSGLGGYVSSPQHCSCRNILFGRLCQLSTALRLQKHLVRKFVSVFHRIEAAETSGLGGYFSCSQHCSCRNIWFGRLCQSSTAMRLQKHLIWELMSVVHWTVAAETSDLGGYISWPQHCCRRNIWFGSLCQLSTTLRLQKHLVWEVMSVVHSTVAAETSGLWDYVSCPQHCGCRNIWFGRLCQLSTALYLQKHLVWEVMSVLHSTVAAETCGLGGYVNCPLHCCCRNIWFERLCQLLTALWLQKHLVWEVLSIVHCTVAAETSDLGGYVRCPLTDDYKFVILCSSLGAVTNYFSVYVHYSPHVNRTSGCSLDCCCCQQHGDCSHSWTVRLCEELSKLWLQSTEL